jgi:Fe-S cluster assembly protein SufD
MTTAVIPHNKSWYDEAFKKLSAVVALNSKTSIQKIKEDGFANFVKLGFPSTKNEEWKYTDLGPIAKTDYSKTTHQANFDQEAINKLLGVELSGIAILVVDGKAQIPGGKLPAGLKIASIMSETDPSMVATFGQIADSTKNSLVALNCAFFEDAVGIEVEKDVHIDQAINLIVVNSGEENSFRFPRFLIKVGTNASLVVTETHLGATASNTLSVSVTEVEVAEKGRCEHIKTILEGDGTTHLGHFAVRMAESSFYRSHCLSFGGKTIRSEICPTLNGENIECHLQGLTVIGGNQHVDNHTVLDHAKPNCHSDEMYKGIYDGKSSGVFSGTIIVRKDAQKTDAIQSNRAILLSDTAKIESRPCLKIWADDVKCTHGATVGQLDEDSLFYLRARGIPAETAKKMLLQAFVAEVTDKLPVPELQKAVELKLLRSQS